MNYDNIFNIKVKAEGEKYIANKVLVFIIKVYYGSIIVLICL